MISSSGIERLRRLPTVNRARGCRLYCSDGRRYLDLYRDGGRAILGHRAFATVREKKSVLERGLAAAVPSIYERRVEKGLRSFFGDAGTIRIYDSERSARVALAEFAGTSPASVCIVDPVVEAVPRIVDPAVDGVPGTGESHGRNAWADATALIWRPMMPSELNQAVKGSGIPLLPVIPSPGENAQAVIFPSPGAPPSELIAGDRLASMVRSIYDLIPFDAIDAISLPGFSAVGPYLVPHADESVYDSWYDGFLRAAILVSPDPGVPSISPVEMSDGERAGLVRAAEKIVGEGGVRGQ